VPICDPFRTPCLDPNLKLFANPNMGCPTITTTYSVSKNLSDPQKSAPCNYSMESDYHAITSIYINSDLFFWPGFSVREREPELSKTPHTLSRFKDNRQQKQITVSSRDSTIINGHLLNNKAQHPLYNSKTTFAIYMESVVLSCKGIHY